MTSSGDGGQSNRGDKSSLKNSSTGVNQFYQDIANMSLNSSQNGGWDVLSTGNTNGSGNRGGWGSWSQLDAKKTSGFGNLLGKLDDHNASEDELVSDDYDSDDSQKSHDSRKRNPLLSEFFETLDDLTADQINEPARQWHCPACQNGPGSIKWFVGMKSFVTHVKTKGVRRPNLHRDLAELLDEELRRKGAILVPAGEVYGQWKGVDKDVEDQKIVWPPMVIVMNTQLEQDENKKWIGMGTQELLDYFDSYEAVKARNSFGPEGHTGMSVLIFESSAIGYFEAERLSKHFEHQGIGREAWDRHPNLFHSGGKRQLYGYLATERDLEIFNQHSSGKLKLKYELVSYGEKVVKQLKQMSKDSQQLIWYKKKVAKKERSAKALEDAFWLLSQKLQKLEEQNLIIRHYHEQNKEEMDSQEKFFKDQLKVIQDARHATKEQFEKFQEECKSVEESCAVVDAPLSKADVEKFPEASE